MPTLQTTKFNLAALEILQRLHSNHPTPMDGEELLGLRDTIKKVWNYLKNTENPDEEYFSYLRISEDTLSWLQDAGMVRYDEMRGHKYPVRIRLTPDGYAAMRNLTQRKYWNFWKRVDFAEYIQDAYDSRKTKRIDRAFNLLKITNRMGGG